MSKRRRKLPTRRRGEWYIAIQFWELESPAFLALSADAVRVYLEMRKRLSFDASNNGHVVFALREAQTVLHSEWRRAANALAELLHYGFVKLRNAGEPGAAIRLASEWQLTAAPCGGQEAAKTFLRWDGAPFKTVYRSRKTVTEKQLPTVPGTAPRRQRDGAFDQSAESQSAKTGQTAGNGTALCKDGRRQRDGTISNTTQGGPDNENHRECVCRSAPPTAAPSDGSGNQLSKWRAPSMVEVPRGAEGHACSSSGMAEVMSR
jgi:hypothetical protein